VKTVKTKKEFEAELAAPGGRLALFYSAWCPFCTAFLPAFEKLAHGAPEASFKVCVDDLAELEDLFSVEVVPTVLYFEDGKLAKRLDGRLGRGLNAEGLSAFCAACGRGQKK
jgi:thioredoxin-like negative regulator of GroEL